MKYLIILSVSFLFACGGEKEPEFDPGIPKEKLIDLIVDLQILESQYQRKFSRVEIYRDALDSASTFVFEDYGVTKSQFENAMAIYSAESDSIYLLYEAALDTISFRINIEQTKL
ncbi:DUF4296 domain-containing protein [Crocinitomix catalasitica]|uniref:DUF4296 domain-containing protein n=1 Tax=Crocinitomix catalasitica TaxID=184607 RepID=UPI0004852729|nr:DUF4296 domain-containing protein [Crocinitomix catalasitica]